MTWTIAPPSTLALAVAIIDVNTPEAAEARCIIKRSLRKNKLRIGRPDEYIGWFVAYPWSCASAIDKTVQASAKAWEDGNNSGCPKTLEACTKRERKLGAAVGLLMAAIDVSIDWPGLYPTYRVDGRTCYDLAGLWIALKDARAKAGASC